MKKKFLLPLLLIPMLISCSQENLPLDFISYDNDFAYIKTKYNVKEDNYYQKDNLGEVNLNEKYPGMNGVTNIDGLSSLYESMNRHILNSDDEVHLLVVPIGFADSDKSQYDAKRTLIQNAFFGQPETTKYQSVASYYNASSYGHAKIVGEVTNWVTYPKGMNDIPDSNVSKDNIISYTIGKLLEAEFDFSPYCSLDERYIDGVYFIYDRMYEKNNSDSIFWATTEHKSSPLGKIVNYSWSSFYFMQDDGDDILTSHYVRSNTFIHETGHLFGLVDYYNTNSHYRYQPTGFMDMMDYNLGDHCSFSKYLLGWTTPKVVTGSGDITIRSFTKFGDFILVPAGKFNNSPFSEYLLVEYFTPVELNNSRTFPSYSYRDAEGNERVFSYPTTYGVRVYHIDARLGYKAVRSPSPYAYIDSEESKIASKYVANTTSIDFYNSNEAKDISSQTLIHLLESSGNNTFVNGEAANNQTLFRRGTTFGEDVFKDFTFNNGQKLDYSFSISTLNQDSVTISFTKK